MKALWIPVCHFPLFVFSQTGNPALDSFLNDPALKGAHAGISLYDPEADSFLINYRADNYFLPASNAKLFTLYAGLKYLGDSIPGLKIADQDNKTLVLGTGDPTFLHPRFGGRKVYDFLKNSDKEIVMLTPSAEAFRSFGDGWSMDDYDAGYAPEKARFPIYGNVVSFYGTPASPEYFPKSEMDVSISKNQKTTVRRDFHKNRFEWQINPSDDNIRLSSPIILSGELLVRFLQDTLRRKLTVQKRSLSDINKLNFNILYSESRDSMLKSMMYESDNFLAEQTLLMASDKVLGKMSDTALISYMLSDALKDIPQQPRWVDGSGLSRYNLFSPNDMVYILKKLMTEFSLGRLRKILPSGGKGTLSGQFRANGPFVFAKTGSMGNTSCLSGYLLLRTGKCLIFSLMINDLVSSHQSFRIARETFIDKIRSAY